MKFWPNNIENRQNYSYINPELWDFKTNGTTALRQWTSLLGILLSVHTLTLILLLERPHRARSRYPMLTMHSEKLSSTLLRCIRLLCRVAGHGSMEAFGTANACMAVVGRSTAPPGL